MKPKKPEPLQMPAPAPTNESTVIFRIAGHAYKLTLESHVEEITDKPVADVVAFPTKEKS